ncbi:TrmB family transcriptional regulator [Halomarina salina]|uniref:TrmB family transcriptional regulator n=1 Tax=Halomarina salina TaxID=1872699 RepID=A0ABD5RJZ6_9EURY|nr:helix-turn-helix domain-containing protein [Halomarina salina]
MGDSTMDESDALDALERLGLTSYEGKVLVGLQKLGTATASEIARVTDVPRSQVYGTADSLEERGLLEVQNASPTRFRAVDLDEAMARLSERFERERRRATEYLREVQGSLASDTDEHRPDIWVTRGTENVTHRVEDLLGDAEERVLLAASDPALLPPSLVATLESLVERGVSVVGMSENPAVLERFSDIEGVQSVRVTEERFHDPESNRMLIVDGHTLLIGMLDATASPNDESAMWSANTRFATMLARIIESKTEQFTDEYDGD